MPEQKRRYAHFGRPRTPEDREKISAGLRKRRERERDAITALETLEAFDRSVVEPVVAPADSLTGVES
jgi:hypothetical protein